MAEFFYMDGKGVYIWSGYAIALVVLLANVWLASSSKKRALLEARRQAERPERSRANNAAASDDQVELTGGAPT